MEMVIPSENEETFGFAFNDIDFSDRLLRLEIMLDDSIHASKKQGVEKYHEWFSCIQQNECSESCDEVKIKTLHISSPILAAKSRFFYKLFKNGMRESQDKNVVSLRIYEYEEATLMNLLKFMYENTLGTTSSSDLVDLLIAADKFEVKSCMRHCVQILLKLSMSLETALLYLDLPPCVLESEIVKPLIYAAKQYVAIHYKDFTKSQEVVLELPLSAVEAVLGSPDLHVVSEDNIFDFALKWARLFYPETEERRGILTKRLVPLICFPNMSCSKLKEVLVCPDFDREDVSKLVIEALFSKLSCDQLSHDLKDLSTKDSSSVGRVYTPHCVVLFDLKKDECACLFPSKQLNSQTFYLGGKKFHLEAHCGQIKDRFGLFVQRAQGSEACTLDFELTVMKKSSREFESKLKVNNHTLAFDGWGMPDLLDITWTDLMSDDNDYFIDDILHLRVELTLKTNISQA